MSSFLLIIRFLRRSIIHPSAISERRKVRGDRVPIFAQTPDAEVHLFAFVLEGSDHFGGRVAEVNHTGFVEAGDDLLDDSGR